VRQVTATEAARRFSEVLDAVEHDGETFVITRGGRAVASIVPATATSGRALKEVLRRHTPDPDWEHDLEEARRMLREDESPWPD
jgi:prevent-host-death family protein